MLAISNTQMPDDESAEEVSIEILLWMGNKLDIMERFLKMSGIQADDIRGMIGHRSFYAGLFAFVMNHEPDLLDFCQDRNIDMVWTRRCYEHFAGESVPWL
jgi:hypothetical protein